ncbi:MAG: M20/M25/M40 family metallo-hydrolase, partial [Terriglobales bacterium]
MKTAAYIVRMAFLVLLVLGSTALAQDPAALRDQVRAYRIRHQAAILRSYADLLAIPNRANDSANIRRNAEHIAGLLRARRVETRLLEHPGTPPVVYGELRAPGATRTIVVYAHYDGQPAEPADWGGADPWKPVLRDKSLEDGGREIPWPALGAPVDPEWRIYARSSSDDKTPIAGWLAALDALRASGIAPSVNVKFFFEGEE